MQPKNQPTFRCRSLDGRYSFDIPPGQSVGVGRHPSADCVIADMAVARRHCRFHNMDGQCMVEIENARGGLRVNGQHSDWVEKALDVGDTVQLLGDLTFIVERADR